MQLKEYDRFRQELGNQKYAIGSDDSDLHCWRNFGRSSPYCRPHGHDPRPQHNQVQPLIQIRSGQVPSLTSDNQTVGLVT